MTPEGMDGQSDAEPPVQVLSAEAVRAPGLVAAFDHARPYPLGSVLPVVEQPLPPRDVLLALVRRRQTRIHERDKDVYELLE
jgi:hypothetical protein